MGRAASAQTYPVSRSGWYWYPCCRDVGQGIPAAHRAFRPTSSPLPHCGTAEGVPTSRAAPGDLTRRQARDKIHSRQRGLSRQESGPFGPHETLCQGAPDRGGGGTLPRLPRWPRSACPDAAGRGLDYGTSPLLNPWRGRLSRPCRRRSLSAAALRGRHGIRHPSCKPELGAPGSNRPAACCGTP